MEWKPIKTSKKKETKVEFWGRNWTKLGQLCCDNSKKVPLGIQIMLTFLAATVLLSSRTSKWINKKKKKKKKKDLKNEMAGPLKQIFF